MTTTRTDTGTTRTVAGTPPRVLPTSNPAIQAAAPLIGVVSADYSEEGEHLRPAPGIVSYPHQIEVNDYTEAALLFAYRAARHAETDWGAFDTIEAFDTIGTRVRMMQEQGETPGQMPAAGREFWDEPLLVNAAHAVYAYLEQQKQKQAQFRADRRAFVEGTEPTTPQEQDEDNRKKADALAAGIVAQMRAVTAHIGALQEQEDGPGSVGDQITDAILAPLYTVLPPLRDAGEDQEDAQRNCLAVARRVFGNQMPAAMRNDDGITWHIVFTALGAIINGPDYALDALTALAVAAHQLTEQEKAEVKP